MKDQLRVAVMPKKSVLDPQGEAVQRALHGAGFSQVKSVRIGKVIEIELEAGQDPEAMRQAAKKMSEQLLANPVMEDFTIEFGSKP